MSGDTDRIAVPTNGHTPRAFEASPDQAPTTQPDAIQPPDPVPTVTSSEMTVSVTPAQIAVGFGVIAGIILMVLGRRAGRGRG